MKEDKPEELGRWKKSEWYEAEKWENKKDAEVVVNINCGKRMAKNEVVKCFVKEDGTISVILKKRVKMTKELKERMCMIIFKDEKKEEGTLGEYVGS
jgi:hypothetical protein